MKYLFNILISELLRRMLEKTIYRERCPDWSLIPINKPLVPESLAGTNSDALVKFKHALK